MTICRFWRIFDPTIWPSTTKRCRDVSSPLLLSDQHWFPIDFCFSFSKNLHSLSTNAFKWISYFSVIEKSWLCNLIEKVFSDKWPIKELIGVWKMWAKVANLEFIERKGVPYRKCFGICNGGLRELLKNSLFFPQRQCHRCEMEYFHLNDLVGADFFSSTYRPKVYRRRSRLLLYRE